MSIGAKSGIPTYEDGKISIKPYPEDWQLIPRRRRQKIAQSVDKALERVLESNKEG
jgi:hypothetical protein